jgi:hypothetical protein
MDNEVVKIIDDIKRLRSRIRFFESIEGLSYFSKEWILEKLNIKKDEQGNNRNT